MLRPDSATVTLFAFASLIGKNRASLTPRGSSQCWKDASAQHLEENRAYQGKHRRIKHLKGDNGFGESCHYSR